VPCTDVTTDLGELSEGEKSYSGPVKHGNWKEIMRTVQALTSRELTRNPAKEYGDSSSMNSVLSSSVSSRINSAQA